MHGENVQKQFRSPRLLCHRAEFVRNMQSKGENILPYPQLSGDHLPRVWPFLSEFDNICETTFELPVRMIAVGQILVGSLFNEPMRVETVRPNGSGAWTVGLVGTQSEKFRSVTLTQADLASLKILD